MAHKDIVIVGGGPAGLLAAISARQSNKNKSVLLLEGNTECGVKLLISGSGQCNFTNNLPVEDFLKRCGANGNYLKKAYYNFDKDAFIHLLDNAGCPSMPRSDGKVFPASLRARDVRDALLRLAGQAGVEIEYNAKVTAIQKLDISFALELQDGRNLKADKLIIAGGGASYPATGSDGQLLTPLKKLGHKVKAFRAHLGSVKIADFKLFSACSGISLQDVRAVIHTKNDSFTAVGDVLITHTGLSGPLILDNCYRLAKGSEIVLRWIPNALEAMQKAVAKYPKMLVLNALCDIPLPKNLLKALLDNAGIDYDKQICNLNSGELMTISAALSYTQFFVSAVEKLVTAMASSGGVPLEEVNAKTMESRICPGLFLAGEILDYNLPSGGFNIQIAASTGWHAGASAVSNK